MAEKQKSPKPKTNNDKKRLQPSAIAVVDNIVFSKTDRWAYYRLSNDVFDFLSTESKVSAANRITNALNNLMTDRKDPLECHLIVTSVPVDVDAWAVQVKETSKDWNRSPGFERYIQEQINYLKQAEYLKKVVYLGVNMGKRGALDMSDVNVLELGLKGAMDITKKWFDQAFAVPTEEISQQEENEARKKEANFYRTLSLGHLGAVRVSSEDILLLIKRQLYPAMPAPYLEVDHENRLGPGDLELELGHAIENKYRWLKVTQMLESEEVVGYRACLSFSKFPKFTSYPKGTVPFLYFPAKLSLPFTLYSRFTLLPSNKMKAQLEKKKKEQKDELENVSVGQSNTSSIIDGGLPSDVLDSVRDIQTMQDIMANDKTPWVEGSYRIIVETPDEETLKKYCNIVKQQYADLEINVSWTAGDQAELFLEQMPGDRVRIPSFKQVTNLSFVATSGFRSSSDVGDLVFGSDIEGRR